jgi:hypothetical protein
MRNRLVIILLISLYPFFKIHAQKLNKKYFENSKWASFNKDQLFYKLDTIKLVRIVENKFIIDSKFMNVADYFEDNDYVTLEFFKRDSLSVYATLIESWSIYTIKGEYKWKFNPKEKTLDLLLNGKVFMVLFPIPGSERKLKLKSQIAGNPDIATVEITLKKISCKK